ncbi:MAG: YwqG family protein, partial [Woeseiaceae bacterium]
HQDEDTSASSAGFSTGSLAEMSNIVSFFKRRGRRQDRPLRDVAALVAPLSRQAIQLLVASDRTPSHFGGGVLMSAKDWPCRDGKPLSLLASIHLESLSEAVHLPWLPTTGRLLFFYDVESQPWGFDPKDRGGWAVLYVDDETLAAPVSESSLPQRYISFRKIETYPSWERPEVALLKLSDAEADGLADVSGASCGNASPHQIGGYPSPIQADGMELECQLVSHGLYCGDSSGYNDPRAGEISSGAIDWKLLLQVASDDELGVMWGDMGMLYFWIREHDARAGRFDKTWVILQCS